MDRNDDDDYKVGYGKPPEHTRFKKGQSGNPKGRRKGVGNFRTDLEKLLESQVTVSNGGRPRKVSTQYAALLRLAERALGKGDRGAIERLLSYAQWSSEERDAQSSERELDGNEAEILARLKADIRKEISAGEDTGKGDGEDG